MHVEPEQVPEPADSGVRPVQAEAQAGQTGALIEVASAGEYKEYPLSEAVRGIGEFGVRGQSAMLLLIASVRRVERDLKHGRDELSELRAANDKLRDEKHAAELRNSVLEERLSSARQQRWVRSILTTLGGLGL